MHKNVLMLPVSFIGYYSEDEPNFPQQNNLILQKKRREFQRLFKT